MPSQQLEVRVRVSGMGKYASEMRQGATATKQLAAAGENVQKVGGQISGIGDKLTRSVTLPIVAVGAAAVKMASDFDNSFTTMQTLAGLSSGEVDGLKESVLGLAGETGRAPQELAEALYFLRSSGLEGAAAMDALEVSAKASAAGLGDTQVIADAVSSAMLGYAESGLEAADATDVLIATAKAGKAEPAELAGQMGRLIPIAAELGITFGDVGGAIATLSTKGNSASDATTQLVNVMGKLLKPSQQAVEQLDAVGLSTADLRSLIAEKGLLGTLEVLKERLGDNGLAKFFEDQQAVIGATSILGGDLEHTRDIFAQVNDSVGETDKAFATWADSMGAKNSKAFADFQVAMIKFGDVIAPIAADVLSFAASLVGAFSDLPGPAQKAVAAFVAILAAIGPLMSVGGRLISVYGSVIKIFDNLTSAGGKAFASAMNAGSTATGNLGSKMSGLKAVMAGAGIAGAIIGIGLAVDAMREAANAKEIDAVTEAFVGMGTDIDESFQKTIRTLESAGELDSVFDRLRSSNQAAAERFIDTAEAAGVSADAIDEMRASLERKREADQQSAADQEANTAAVEGTTEAMADQEEAVNEAAEAYRNYADTIRAAVDPVFGLQNALRQNEDAQRGVVEAQAELDKAIKEHGHNSTEAAEATIALQDAMLGVEDSALGVTTAAADLNAAVAENPGLVDDALAALQTWRDQGIIPTDEQLKFLQDQIKATALQGVALDEVDPSMNVTTRGTNQARSALGGVLGAALSIPATRQTQVSTLGTIAARRALAEVRDTALSIPNSVSIGVHVGGNIGAAMALLAASHHAGGGPMRPGEMSWVGENGPELYVAGPHGGHVYNQQQLAAMSGPMHAAGGFGGGGGGQVVNLDLRGAVIGSQREFDRMVQRAFNVRSRKGRGVNAA